MASSEGQTELLSGWSCVVHQPSDDPEPSELPSTVDITAFSSEINNVDPATSAQNVAGSDSDSESDSNSESSCSQTDTSDSDSSSSSSTSRTPSPEFAITTQQPNCLRLTIATVRKTASVKSCSSSASSDDDSERLTRVRTKAAPTGGASKKSANANSSSGSSKKDGLVQQQAGKNASQRSKVSAKRKKMASLPLSRSSTYSTSDSDDSDADSAMLAGCSLQEIRQEDLAAILPDQQECDAFDAFNETKRDVPANAKDDASGSDMELPQQSINALIQRTTESSSEGEPPNPGTLYANSLLQQFVAQTQAINTTQTSVSEPTSAEPQQQASEAKRKRGRPKKVRKNNNVPKKAPPPPPASAISVECDPNVSPDSGIQNSPDHVTSPECSPRPNKPVKKQKMTVTSNRFDRILYGHADRVLYPPRRKGRPPLVEKKKGPGRPPKLKSEQQPSKTKRLGKILQNSNHTNEPKSGKATHLDEICERVSKSLEFNHTKKDKAGKYLMLKNAKLMHSKRKHRKHKKCKFKILKPIAQSVSANDAKFNSDIDKLIIDFVKLCNIATTTTTTTAKENVPEMLLKNNLKKVSKKRKTKETNANSNEQRLPLKKRHYHVAPNNTDDLDATETKHKTNNNDYNHIDEAIEACITKYSTLTTPKKRHRLENLNVATSQDDEEKPTPTTNEPVKKSLAAACESSSTSTARKKHRLEDLTSNLASKINCDAAASATKFPICKKVKPIAAEKLDAVVDEKPTGIFMPTVDLDLPLDEHDSKANIVKVDPEQTVNSSKAEDGVSTAVKKPNIKEMKRKVRKRRTINRTGFPTVKKKKKKVVVPAAPCIEETPPSIECCDRVPKDGEECNTFLERTSDELSECNSLPQDERLDFEREPSPATSDFSLNNIKKSSSLEDLSLELRLERLKSRRAKQKSSALRRLRDISPASSVDKQPSVSGDESRRRKTPRWRKKYLVAGLFSDYYKKDVSAQQRSDANNKTKIVYKPEEHPYGLLPAPYHCGKFLRCRKIPFQLPYDLWWQHTHAQLPGRDVVPSWNYKKIRTNVYNVKITQTACEPQACNCTTSGCGDNCINRLVLAECPATHRCQNQKIQKHEWAPGLEKFMTEDKGWGVKTNLPIKNGEFILEYVGEVVADQEFKERMASIYINDTHHYCLHLDGGLVIDGHRMGGDGRFVNHSCAPNCEIQKWSVNGQFRMALFALRDISAGEELTYDYNFSLFNPAEGQQCKCGSEQCRGVIGGKSQRVRQIPTHVSVVPARVGRPRKSHNAKKTSVKQMSAEKHGPPQTMTQTQRTFVLSHHCFLLRNLKKVKRLRERSVVEPTTEVVPQHNPIKDTSATFLNHLNALRQPARNITTRRFAQVKDDPQLKKAVHLANVLKDIYQVVVDTKDEKGEKLSAPFLLCPSKRKLPDYYQKIAHPIDLQTIEQKIATGMYKTLESFDADMLQLFANVIKYFGRTNELGITSARLKKIYNETLPKFQHLLGAAKLQKTRAEEEDIIRCICGMYKDEGLMIQCERCLVWQHCECVKADEKAPSYHCEKCVPRQVDYEIALDEYTEHGHQYYMTLMRGDLQLRQGDTVYMLRDILIPGTDRKHTYDTIGEIKYTDLDIFRIERLWKDGKTGKRFAYGHHYLRPHETYHEPTRKFYPNEVMRVPLYEAVPVELVISHCWVMDPNTYCKGRPHGAPDAHIYICEYRVDKSARLFSKVAAKAKFPICTKSYAFERFDTRRKISRTYTPHDLDPAFVKQRGRQPKDCDDAPSTNTTTTTTTNATTSKPIHSLLSVPQPIVRTPAEQKTRLNGILLKLLSKMPTKHVLNISYLLEGGRRRKKQT